MMLTPIGSTKSIAFEYPSPCYRLSPSSYRLKVAFVPYYNRQTPCLNTARLIRFGSL